MRPDVTWQPKLHTLASGLRELGCHSSSSLRPLQPLAGRLFSTSEQYPNLPDAHTYVERRHRIRTMRGSTTNDYSDWHQHPSSERQLIFFAADLDKSASADDGPPAAYLHLLDAVCWQLFLRHHRPGAVPGTTVTPHAAHVVCSLWAGGKGAGASSGSDIRAGSALPAHAHTYTCTLPSSRRTPNLQLRTSGAYPSHSTVVVHTTTYGAYYGAGN